MAKKPEISVILTTRDRSSWLQGAIESIFEQSFCDIEVLVIDDGSKDNTPQVLSDIQNQVKPFTFRVYKTPGLGVSAARNLGIRASQGALIAFLDCDDRWLPEKLAKQFASLKKNPHVALCHTEEIWFRNGKRVNPCKHHAKNGGEIFFKCLDRCVISPSATLIRRTVLDEVGGFDESLPACEDYDLWLRVTLRYPVLFLNEPLIIKNGGHADQLSQHYPIMDRFRIQALQKVLLQLDKPLASDKREGIKRTLAKKSKIIAQGAEKRGHKEIAEQYWQIWKHANDS